MQEIKKQIQEYIKNISNGAVKLSDDQAKRIINIVEGRECTATLFRYDMQSDNDSWQEKRTVRITADQMKEAIEQSLNKKPIEKEYKWELKNRDGEIEHTIYTINSILF